MTVSMFPNSQNSNTNNKDFREQPINDGSRGIALKLETLSATYNNLLRQYNQASRNYIDYLHQQSNTPCGAYGPESTDISQSCYNHIWQNVNCTTQAPNVSPNSTLDELVGNAWQIATQTDYNSRETCYGSSGNAYIILGIGTDGRLYSRQGLDAPWQIINDNTYECQGISTMNNGQGLLGIGGYYIYQKSNYLSNWTGPVNNGCCVTSVAMSKDGTVVGVGLNNLLWSKPNLNGNWTQTSSSSEWVTYVCIAPDDSIFVVGGGGTIWKKKSYLNLPSQTWEYQGDNSCCVKAITIAPDGTFIAVGMDDRLYTKANYQDLSTPWQGPHDSENSSCCVTSITTVANPNYNSSQYNRTTKPNYNVGQQPLTSIGGQVFWGTGQAGSQSVYTDVNTVGECQALCSSTNNCTGATFNPTAHGQPMCWLRTGESKPIVGLDTDNAIIPKGVAMLNIMENINQQLIDINTQILDSVEKGEPVYNNEVISREQKAQELLQNYKSLQSEREKILKKVNEYEGLNQQHDDGNIMINHNYYSFILLFALVIGCIFILYKFSGSSTGSSVPVSPVLQSGGELGKSTYYVIFVIILVSLFIKYYPTISNFFAKLL